MPQYQGIWTLAQAAQLQSTQRWATDPLFENTTLLLQADNAANGAQNNTFLDSSSNNFTITRNGNTTQGTFTPFSQSPGWWGNYFDGTGDFLTAVGANLALGTGDFTIEFWFYAAAYSSAVDSSFMFDSRSGNNTTGFFIGPVFNNTQTLHVGQNASPIITANTTYPLNTWIHCAVVRSSGTITLYQNGISVGSVANTTNNTATTNYIASGYWQPSGSGQMFNGYLSNLRISNTARYTANFTPSASVFVSDSNTRLLACQSNRFLDSSSNAYPITPYGTPSVQAFSPFAPQYQYTPSVTGGSGYFDGTGDYLSVPSTSNLAFGTGDFCVEFWLYRTGTTGGIFSNAVSSGGGDAQFEIQLNGTNKVILIGWNTIFMTGATTINANTWYHIAVVRSGTSMAIFVNGTRDATATSANNFSSTNAFVIGAQAGGAGTTIGYISSLRSVKGAFVYNPSSTTVTIPTAPVTAITNTQLLLNFTNAGIYDGTLKNNLETVGNAQVSTSVVKYGTGSMYFDGTGDRLQIPITPSFYLGTTYTIEFWMHPTATDTIYRPAFSFSETNIGAFAALQMYLYNGVVYADNRTTTSGAITSITGSYTANVWSHVALAVNSTSAKLFINGNQVGSTTTFNEYPIAKTLFFGIGDWANGYSGTAGTGSFLGYIDDLRITKGIARYTANFIPPSVALPRQ